MMGTRLHAKATDAAVLLPGDNLSPVASAPAEDRAAMETLDFASTLQDLIDSTHQKASLATSDTSVAAGRTSTEEASRPTAPTAATIDVSQQLFNRSWAPAVPGDTVYSAANSAYVAARSSQAPKAYQPVIRHFEPLPAATSTAPKSSDPKDQSISSNPQASRVATTGPSDQTLHVDDSLTSRPPLARDLGSTTTQEMQHTTDPARASLQSRASSSESTEVIANASTGDDSLTTSAVKDPSISSNTQASRVGTTGHSDQAPYFVDSMATKPPVVERAHTDDDSPAASTVTVASYHSQHQDTTTSAPRRPLSSEVSSPASVVNRPHTQSLRPSTLKVDPRALPATVAGGVTKQSTVNSAGRIEVNESKITSQIYDAGISSSHAMRAISTAIASLQDTINREDAVPQAATAVSDSTDSANHHVVLLASSPAPEDAYSRAVAANYGRPKLNTSPLPSPPASRPALLKPISANHGSVSEAPADLQTHADRSPIVQVTPTGRRTDPTKATVFASDGDDSTQSPQIRLVKSVNSTSRDPALSPSQSSSSSALGQTDDPTDQTPLTANNNHEDLGEDIAPTSDLSSRPSHSPSVKPTGSKLNALDQLTDDYNRQPVTDATNATSHTSTSSDNPARTISPIEHNATAGIASDVTDAKQAAGITSHSLLTLNHSQSQEESDVIDVAAKTGREVDGIANRELPLVVSSDAKHLASGAKAYPDIPSSQGATQTSNPSDSTIDPSHGTSSQSQLVGASDVRLTRAATLSIGEGNRLQPNTPNATRANSLKASDREQTKSHVVSDDSGAAQTDPTYHDVEIESLTSGVLHGADDREAVTNSPTSPYETRSDLQVEKLTISNAASTNKARPNAATTTALDNATPTDEPAIQTAPVGTSGARRESSVVSTLNPARTRPDDRSGTSQLPANSPVLRQSTHTADLRLHSAYDDSLALAANTYPTTVSEHRQVRASAAAVNDSASLPKSLDQQTSKSVSPALDTEPTPSNSAEPRAHQGRYLTADATDQTPSSSPQLIGLSASANTQAEPPNPQSHIAVQEIETHTPDTVVTSDGVFRTDGTVTLKQAAGSAPIRLIQEVTPAIVPGQVATLTVESSIQLASDHAGVDASGHKYDSFQSGSSASEAANGAAGIESVASSTASPHETRPDLLAKDSVDATASPANEAFPSAVAADASANATHTDKPVREMAPIGSPEVQREASVVSTSNPVTTQPDALPLTSQLPANSPSPRQPTRSADDARANSPYDNSSLFATDAHLTTVSEDRQVGASPALNDSASSHPKSLDEETSRPVSAVLETGPTLSDSAEAGAHQSRYSTMETANDATSLSPQTTGTPVSANAQAEPDRPQSYTTVKQGDKTYTPGVGGTSDGVFRSDDAPAPGRGAESAPVSLVQEVSSLIESGRVANLKVELANGQTANATVRERAGSIDVKIVTPTSESAQRVSSEIDTMRQNLDAAGMRLGEAEVSYQPGGNGGRGGNGYQRPPQQDTSTKDEQIFSISEVTE